jgi:hypothetical protein
MRLCYENLILPTNIHNLVGHRLFSFPNLTLQQRCQWNNTYKIEKQINQPIYVLNFNTVAHIALVDGCRLNNASFRQTLSIFIRNFYTQNQSENNNNTTTIITARTGGLVEAVQAVGFDARLLEMIDRGIDVAIDGARRIGADRIEQRRDVALGRCVLARRRRHERVVARPERRVGEQLHHAAKRTCCLRIHKMLRVLSFVVSSSSYASNCVDVDQKLWRSESIARQHLHNQNTNIGTHIHTHNTKYIENVRHAAFWRRPTTVRRLE